MSLLNCPECDSDLISVDSSRELRISQVTCGDCGHQIQESVSEDRIIGKWNKHVKRRRLELNRLEKVSVVIRFASASGYSSKAVYQEKGNLAAFAAIKELARVLAIDGAGEEAIEEVRSAVAAVSRQQDGK